MDLSIIIPFHNEERNAAAVINEARKHHPVAEIIAIDDGSTDNTGKILASRSDIRLISFPRSIGQSGALFRGLSEARGDILVVIDGDGQSSIADIQRLITYLPEYDFVNGYRTGRQDSISRRAASRLANAIRNWITHDGMKDTGGSPKIMKKECVPHLIPINAMHRFIPALLAQSGFRIIEVPVAHYERQHGTTHYDYFSRGLNGIWDLIGMQWLLKRRVDTENWIPSQDLESAANDDENASPPGESSSQDSPQTPRST